MRNYPAKFLQFPRRLFIAALLSCGSMAQAAAPEADDQAAFEELRQAVIAAQRQPVTAEFPLESFWAANTSFGIPMRPLSFTPEGQAQKPADIRDDEWQAFPEIRPPAKARGSFPVLGGIPCKSYALYDLDGDGLRDLLLLTPPQKAGRGLLYAWRRVGAKFQTAPATPLGLRDDRYNDADFYWTRSQGRVYLVQYQRQLGKDTVQLLSPFQSADAAPTLSVTYRYWLEPSAEANAGLRQAINRGLQTRMSAIWSQPPRRPSAPSCSDPCQPEAKAASPSCGYAPDVAYADFPVEQNGRCQPARLIARDGGAYGGKGLLGRIVVGAENLRAEQQKGVPGQIRRSVIFIRSERSPRLVK